jgi:CRP-like cAMP-binding protein
LIVSDWTAVALIRRLEARHGLVLPGVDALAQRLQAVALRPRQAAFHQGEPCPYVFVVREGLLKQLYTQPDGSEWIKSFAGPGDLFACLQALDGGVTAFASVAIEPSVVERIDFAALEQQAEQHLAWQKALRLGFQALAALKVERERELLTFSARELYERLAASAPEWIDRVPQKDLAAFLGVTPVGLNRIIRRGAG